MIIINQFWITFHQRVNPATTLQRGKAREESTSLFGGVEQEKSRWKLTKYKIQEIQNTKNKIQNKRTNIDNQTRSKQKSNRAIKRKASRYWANEESKKTCINDMKNQQIKTEKTNHKKIKGSRSHVELSALASYPPSPPLWSSRPRTLLRWQKTYFFVNIFFWQRLQLRG